MNSKWCADVSEWSEHKKNMNVLHFECDRNDVSRALNYFKQTYPPKMTVVKAVKPLGYNCSFISIVGSYGPRLDPSILQVRHIKIQALMKDHMISKKMGGGLLRPS